MSVQDIADKIRSRVASAGFDRSVKFDTGADGVIVIPPARAQEIADAALLQEEEDAWIAARVAEGHPVEGLFPMNAHWRAIYEESR